jgi:hypothetical protein
MLAVQGLVQEKPKVSVKLLLHAKLAGVEPARTHFPLRASTLLKKDREFCPREHALLDLGLGKMHGEFVGTSLRHTFNHGKDTEKRVRNVYLRKEAVGLWKCRVCRHVHHIFGNCPDPAPCPKCGHKFHWEYVEPEFTDPDTMVQGHIDILLKFQQKPKLHMVELKTMAPDEFKTLAAPLAEHRQRTALYLQLTARSSWEHAQRVDTSEASILYISKGYGCKDNTLRDHGIKDMPMSPYKEFIIKRDDTLNVTPLAKARVIKVWRDDKQGMPGASARVIHDPKGQDVQLVRRVLLREIPEHNDMVGKGEAPPRGQNRSRVAPLS